MNKSEAQRSNPQNTTASKAIASGLAMRTFSHSLLMALLNTRELLPELDDAPASHPARRKLGRRP
jgi:hypothetical protein